MANLSVSDIYGRAQDLLRMDGTTAGIPGLEESRTIDWINDLHKRFFETFSENGVSLPTYMRREYGYTAASSTALAAAVAAGAATLTIDSSAALDSSGAALIYKNSQYDIFTFTGNSGGSVTGVSGVTFAHEEDEIVSKLYALPSDFGAMRTEKGRGEGVRINGVGYYQCPDMPGASSYSLWQNPTTAAWYLWLPEGTSGDILTIYDKTPTALTTTASTIDIPSQYSDHMWIVWGLVAIFRQVLDEDYVPNKEIVEQQRIITSALNRRNVGKRISASSAYFRRHSI